MSIEPQKRAGVVFFSRLKVDQLMKYISLVTKTILQTVSTIKQKAKSEGFCTVKDYPYPLHPGSLLLTVLIGYINVILSLCYLD